VRRGARAFDGKQADVIWYVKDNKSRMQAVRFPKTRWSEAEARAMCKRLGGSFEAAAKTQEADRQTLGRQPGGKGEGPDGICVCRKCGYEMEHDIGDACNKIKCPKCGTLMTRKIESAQEADRTEELVDVMFSGLSETDLEGLREVNSVQPTAPDESGISRNCVLLQGGINKTGSRYYTASFLKDNVGRFEGALGHMDHPRRSDERDIPERTMATLALVTENARYDADQVAVVSDVRFLDTDPGRNMQAAFADKTVRENAGLSIYWPYRVRAQRKKVNEADVTVPLELVGDDDAKFDIDCVRRPTGGGRVNPINETDRSEHEMVDYGELTADDLRAQRPDIVAELTAEDTPQETEEDNKTEKEPQDKTGDKTETTTETQEQAPTESDRMGELEKRLRQWDAHDIVRDKLDEAKLPDSAAELIESDFRKAECADAELFGKQVDGRIEQVRKLLKEAGEIGRVQGVMAESDTGEDFNMAKDLRELHGIKEADEDADKTALERIVAAIEGNNPDDK